MLISFEGTEGSGKSTQVNLLSEYLQNKGHQVLVTKEPGGTLLGAMLRNLLLHKEDVDIAPISELLLYTADRAQHVTQVIRPALLAGSWVICDRFIDSTLAYQGYGRGLNLHLIHDLNRIATDGLIPHKTFYLRLPVETGLNRVYGRSDSDRIESESLEFHKRVQAGFDLLMEGKDYCITINADDKVSNIFDQIKNAIETNID